MRKKITTTPGTMVIIFLLMLLFAVPVNAAQSGNLDAAKPTQTQIDDRYTAFLGKTYARVFDMNPVISGNYAPGKLNSAYLDKGLAYLNLIRFTAGLSDTKLDADWTASAQYGALLDAAVNELNHFPSQPSGMSKAMYEKGYDATTSSNLSWYYPESRNSLVNHINGCSLDADTGNLDREGHRRWLLSPNLTKVGFGQAGCFASTRVFSNDDFVSNDVSDVNYDFISWPSSGEFPMLLTDYGMPWTVTVNPEKYENPSLADITVIVRHNGKSWKLDKSSYTAKPSSMTIKYLNVNTQGMGVTNCIIFLNGIGDYTTSANAVKYDVTVSGLKKLDGSSAEISYSVNIFKEKVTLGGGSMTTPANVTFSGKAFTPAPVVKLLGKTLAAGTDYRLSYKNNINAGTATVTATGIGSYAGSISRTFKIAPANIKNASVSGLKAYYEYTGSEITPAVTLSMNGKTLKEGTDYTVLISENENPGTAKITLTGKGNLTGTIEKTFPVSPKWNRISGKNRYETAAAIAREAFPDGAAEAVLVSGEGYADALAASGYAGLKNCPVLLTAKAALSDATKTLIQDLKIQKITIIGGEASVSAAVSEALPSCGVSRQDRIFGKNRYETSEKVFEAAAQEFGSNPKNACIITTGQKVADALSISPWSYAYGMPILLAKNGGLDEASLAIANRFGSVYILGGDSSVHTSVETALTGSITRYAGNNRYETSVKIAQGFVGGTDTSYRQTAFASGKDTKYPDALVGGMLQAKRKAPILLVDGTAGAAFGFVGSDIVKRSDVTSLTVLGGKPSVTDETITKLSQLW